MMSGMDTDIFDQFIEQLQRYVRERLLPAEKEILETDKIPESIMTEHGHAMLKNFLAV